ncbi:hypothetical protein RJ641_030337, partial [Dillenia turbinata]
MDTLLLHTPSSMATKKRPCSSLSSPNPNDDDEDRLDLLLEKLLELSDLSSSSSSPSSSSLSLDLSFDRLLESRASSKSDQSLLIDRALLLGSLLLEAGNRSARKRASKHNSVSWALAPDLTIKVFSLLDTQSLCYAAATCSMFYKCAMDPMCYSNIDLTTVVPKVNNAVVSTMVQRAGKVLRSLKLGIVPGPTASFGSSQPLVYTIRNSIDASGFSWNDKRSRQGKESSFLTRSCLISLTAGNGAAGALLRRLHLYNIERMDNAALCTALAACPSLLDLEIVGLHVELRQTLESVSTNCHLIERLFFESSKTGRDDSLKASTCVDLVNNCPHLNSLALRGFKLHDYKVRILVKGFRNLKLVDFSTSYSITGTFLRNLGTSTIGSQLGDISNREGLASEGDWYVRCYNPSIIHIKQVLEIRPDICLLAEFPSEGSSSESSYNSDQGSGNEDGRDPAFVIYEESSDESSMQSDTLDPKSMHEASRGHATNNLGEW